VSFASVTLCVASQRVFIFVVVYFVTMTQSGNFWIHSRKLSVHLSTHDVGWFQVVNQTKIHNLDFQPRPLITRPTIYEGCNVGFLILYYAFCVCVCVCGVYVCMYVCMYVRTQQQLFPLKLTTTCHLTNKFSTSFRFLTKPDLFVKVILIPRCVPLLFSVLDFL
jgi:hypothetical protein